MKRKSVLFLAGGTVVAGAVAVHQWNKRRRHVEPQPCICPGRQLRVVPSIAKVAVIAAPMAIPYVDFGDIVNNIWFIGNLVWDQVSQIVRTMVRTVADVLQGMINAVDNAWKFTTGLIKESYQWVAEEVASVSRAVGGVIAETTDRMAGAFSNFRQNLFDFMEGVWDRIEDFIEGLIPDWIEDLAGDVIDFIRRLMEFGIDGFVTLFRIVAEAGIDGITTLLNFLRDPIGFTWDLIRDLVQDAIDAANAIIDWPWDILPDLFWTALGATINVPDSPKDLITAAKWLWEIALAVTKGDFERAMRQFVRGAYEYTENEVTDVVNRESFLLKSVLYELMGVEYNTPIADAIDDAKQSPR